MRLTLILVFLLLSAVGLSAQQALDPNATPEAGSLTLSPGFQPDPLRVPALITGGGDIDANSRALGPDCTGFITAEPDFRLLMTAPGPLLRLIFIADAITSDTTLVVRSPDGIYHCNNNAFGLFNPMVDVSGAPSGDYAVWVGGFTPGGPVYGSLYLTENEGVIPGSTSLLLPAATTVPTLDAAAALTPTRSPGTFLDPAAAPVHGSTELASGFLPDPFWTLAIGGGFLPVPALDGEAPESSACGGFAESAPDFVLHWSGQGTRLRFHFIPASPAGASEPDAALIARGPDGRFTCNRDFAPGGYTRPSIEYISPLPGDYAIWVAGEAAPGDALPGLLYVTELMSTPETLRVAESTPLEIVNGPDPLAAGPAVIFDAPAPDPLTVALTAEQIGLPSVDLGALNPDARAPNGQLLCEGYITPTPTLTVTLPLAFPYLRAFFIADSPDEDAVMVVRMPDGRWYCGDDALETLNPQVDIVGNAATGAAQVWIGSYSPGAPLSGRLALTRGRADVLRPDVPGGLMGLEAFGPGGLPTPTLDPLAVVTSPAPENALPTPEAQAFPAAVLDPYGATNYGETALVSATVAHTVQAVAGGDVDAALLGNDCVGFVSANPDYRIIWSGNFSTLRFFFTGDGDATMIVLDPAGALHCNDDSFASQSPTVDVPSAPAGVYNVWLGSFEAGGAITGTLHVTEDLNRSPASP